MAIKLLICNFVGRVMTDMAVQTDLTFNDLKDCTDQDLQGGSLSRTIFVKNVTKDDTSCTYTGTYFMSINLYNYFTSQI